jgi:hypothetical protein
MFLTSCSASLFAAVTSSHSDIEPIFDAAIFFKETQPIGLQVGIPFTFRYVFAFFETFFGRLNKILTEDCTAATSVDFAFCE